MLELRLLGFLCGRHVGLEFTVLRHKDPAVDRDSFRHFKKTFLSPKY